MLDWLEQGLQGYLADKKHVTGIPRSLETCDRGTSLIRNMSKGFLADKKHGGRAGAGLAGAGRQRVSDARQMRGAFAHPTP